MIEPAFSLFLSLTGQRGRTTSSVMAQGVDCAGALYPARFVSFWPGSCRRHTYTDTNITSVQTFSKETQTQGGTSSCTSLVHCFVQDNVQL